MVLCGQVYCSNCILKSVLVEVGVHTSIRNKKNSKSSGKTYSYHAAVVDRGAQQLCHIFTKGRPCSSTPCKYKHNCYHNNNCLGAHPEVTNAPDSPVQAVDLAQKEKITSQANLPSNTVVILSNDITETGESIKYSSKKREILLKNCEMIALYE